jgi:hypothetical protein
MKIEIPIQQLLKWRLAQAEAAAPPAPRAARLLELSRPWWEVVPERFQSLLERLSKMHVALGHAMIDPGQSRAGHPVPALLVGAVEETESCARVLYLSIRDRRLRLRFQLEGAPRQADPSLDVTFVSDSSAQPLLVARATLSGDGEYRLEAELSDELSKTWRQLKVTDRMPFRWILHAGADGG